MADTIDTALDLLQKIRDNDIVRVKFLKADGTERIMKCTLNFDRIPQVDKPKDVNIPQIMRLAKNGKVIHVYDVEKSGWRSLPFDRSQWMEASDKKHYQIRTK